ncbi:MAG: TonB-dependent receptor [Alphaproteobacteria bacterium]|nr:TonB-dependent receptor [Alphaproteobacteria bacterium]
MHTRFLAGSALACLLVPATAIAQPSTVETVVVTASPFAQDPNQLATIVDVVDRDQILNQGGASLSDSLKDVPGVAGTGFAAGANRPVIRGMDAARVAVLENGLSSSDVSDIGPDHGVPIDPMVTQRIEVLRGAGTLRYGSSAIGGVVNAIDNRVPLSLPGELRQEANGSYDSVSQGGQGGVMFDAAAGNFAFHGDAFLRRDGDYDTPLGMQANSFSNQDGFSGGSSYFFGDSRVGASVTHYDADYGIPAEVSHIVMRQTKFTTDDSFAVDAGALQKINLQASYSIYAHNEVEGDGTIATTFLNDQFDGRAEALFGPIGPFSNTALGVQVGNRSYSALGEDAGYLYPSNTISEAGYLFTELPFTANLKLQAAGRIEQVHVSGTPASNTFTKLDFTPVSGSAGLLWDAASNLKLGLTLSSTARAPAQTELFARGGHDGPGTFETGDPTLKIERSNSLEGTFRTSLGPIDLEGSLWGSSFDNYIYGDLTGSTCDDDGNCVPGDSEELKELNYAQRDADFWGFEAKASAPLWQTQSGTLGVNMLADYVRATFGGGFGNVPRIQPFRVGGGLSWDSQSFNAGFLVMGVGDQNEIGAYETTTPGYVDVSAHAEWHPFAERPGFSIAVVGHNLADEIERNAVAFNRDEVVMPGRSIRVVLHQSL